LLRRAKRSKSEVFLLWSAFVVVKIARVCSLADASGYLGSASYLGMVGSLGSYANSNPGIVPVLLPKESSSRPRRWSICT
jgi:hypothetical protein